MSVSYRVSKDGSPVQSGFTEVFTKTSTTKSFFTKFIVTTKQHDKVQMLPISETSHSLNW